MGERDQTTEHSLAGNILMATPHIGDIRFDKSVIIVCVHDQNGAMGLVINKPLADLDLTDLLSQLQIKPSEDIQIKLPVYMGGPVQPERGFLLHSNAHSQKDSTRVGSKFAISGTIDILESLTKKEADLPKDILFILGYVGWGAGQLEQEIKDNAWLTVEATQELIFETESNKLWNDSMVHLGVNPSILVSPAGQA